METAADINPLYTFNGNYSGQQLGYFITSITGVHNNDNCNWILYYQDQGQDQRYKIPYGPSNFIIPSSNGIVIYELTQNNKHNIINNYY